MVSPNQANGFFRFVYIPQLCRKHPDLSHSTVYICMMLFYCLCSNLCAKGYATM